ALVYSALAGWSLPTQRAFIMVSVVMAAVFLQRTVVPSRTLALALLVVLVLDPFAVLSPGFWLSFGAVSVILFLVVGRPAPQSLWAKWGRTQWFVSLGLFPFLLAFFQQASLSAPLANLIAIPLVSLLVVPMVLTGLLLTPISGQLAAYLFRLAAELMAWLYSGLDWTAALPLSRFYAPVPDILTLLSAITGLLLLMMPRGWPVRWFGVILFSPLLLIRPAQPGQGEAWFSLLDVGQGLAAVVQTRRHVLVFDTGPWFSDRFDAGDAVVVPFLRQQGIGYIDTLVVSHGDIDHRGGVDSLRAQFPVSRLISSDTTLLHRLNGEPCRAGQQWEWDGVTFRVLSPAEDQGSQRENNQSCVLRIVSQNGSLLLPGDIEVEAEQALLGRYAESDLQADILVAPHHGSKTSSSDAFIRAVKPKFVLYPIGYRNRYHFPHSQVTSRLKAVSAQSFDSASHGAILFRTGPDGRWQEPITWRQENQRYWHVRIGHQTQN
ncbi:MAG: DNA internalization-related competence protein ComEC/Rec2, partial [Gammaproteobacteria bacterium]|nr:DNA internalization-related competence protein ComEC/Rec2 [Gammaproteobacteria bacterium]